MATLRSPLPPLLLTILLALPAAGRAAVAGEVAHRRDLLGALAVRSSALAATQELVPIGALRDALPPAALAAWTELRRRSGVDWQVYVDRRNGLVASAQGGGIALLPGRGNRLTLADLAPHLGTSGELDLDAVERIVRDFLPRVAPLLGVAGESLVLDRGRSAHPADYLWFVDFDVLAAGLPIDGARVVFRINNGNLVQFGSEQLPAPGAAPPADTIGRDQALAALSRHIGGFAAADTFLDSGHLHLVPVIGGEPVAAGSPADSAAPPTESPNTRRGLAHVWQLLLQRQGVAGTWRARVDAASGELLEFVDLDRHASARVTGGVALGTGPSDLEGSRPMPFAPLSTGGYANSAGLFTPSPVTVGTNLLGKYVWIFPSCGALSLLSNAEGDLLFGTSPSIDCSTPGFGGPGNTRAARAQAYWMNRIAEVARGWLPQIPPTIMTVEVDTPQPCTAGVAYPGTGSYLVPVLEF